MNQAANPSRHPEQARAWWHYPIVWMVISGPLAVVIASIFTASLAIRHVDPVLDTSADQVTSRSKAPALQARNHASEQARQPADR